MEQSVAGVPLVAGIPPVLVWLYGAYNGLRLCASTRPSVPFIFGGFALFFPSLLTEKGPSARARFILSMPAFLLSLGLGELIGRLMQGR
jgi:hypothetical protein